MAKFFEYHKYLDPETGRVYLERWNFDFLGLFSIKLHRIHDHGIVPWPHDHPWHFATVLLCGGYVEEIHHEDGTTTTKEQTAPAILFRKASHRHRVIRTIGKQLSLVFCSPRMRHWGYWVDGKWIWWPAYFWPDEIIEMAQFAKDRKPEDKKGFKIRFPKKLPYIQD